MSKDKYPSIFFRPVGSYCVYHPSNIFSNAQNLLEDLKIGEYHSTGKYFGVVAGAFSRMMQLDK